MPAIQSQADELRDNYEDSLEPGNLPQRSIALSNKLSSVLSASYADAEIRDGLRNLDQRGIQNTPEVRRNLRLDLQKEVIDRNGEIIKDFGQVAEVCLPVRPP